MGHCVSIQLYMLYTGVHRIVSAFGSIEAEIDPSENKTTKTTYIDGTH